MKNAVSLGVTLLLLTGLFSFPAVAQNLVIVRPGQEFVSRVSAPSGRKDFHAAGLYFSSGQNGHGDRYTILIIL